MEPSRRQVLRGAGAGRGAAALGSVLMSAASAEAAVVPDARSVDFNPGWRFVLVNADGVTDPSGTYANAYREGFDDSAWRVLDLPHDWSIELPPVNDGHTISGNGFYQGGLGWYRKTFTLPKATDGKRIWLEFDDLTGKVHTDGVTPNVIAVQASNQIPSSRWYSGSGIYRSVHLIVTGPTRVARHGTFVTTPELSSTVGQGYGQVQIKTNVQNDAPSAAHVTVLVTVRDAAGALVAQGSTAMDVPPAQTVTATNTVRVSHPRLWSVDDPALYSVETRLVTNGVTVDEDHGSFGFRYFSFDPAGGFSLNGHHLKIQGVNLHHTQGPLGAVVLPDALERQMKSMGVNALRTAHNPPAPELTAVCERLGILMMVEAFDTWRTGKLPYDYHLYFDQWSDSDIKEMVNAHKNSPAVVLWSIGNETPDTGLPGGPAIAQKLIAGVRDLDPRVLPRPRPAQHRGELHPRQAEHLLLRQQPRVLVHERGIRAEEDPGPAVLGWRLPVGRAGLHRGAHAVRRVPGQGVVLRRGRHGRVRQGRLSPVPQPVEHRADGAQPSTFTFDPVTTTQIRLTMTSPNPGTASGFLTIADLKAT